MIKTQSLKLNRDFRRLYNRGKSAAAKNLVVYARHSGSKPFARLGITASLKLGNAVRRNRIRRRIKECYRSLEPGIRTGIDIVIVARHGAHDAPFDRLRSELASLLTKLRVLP